MDSQSEQHTLVYMQYMDLQSILEYIDRRQLTSPYYKLHLIHMEMDCRGQ